MVSSLLFLKQFYTESIIEGWANTIATERLATRERFAAQEARTLQAENERLKAHLERQDLLHLPEAPLSLYSPDKENTESASNTSS